MPLLAFSRLVVGVEDAQSDAAIPITLLVSCGMTISQLKDEVPLSRCQGTFPSDTNCEKMRLKTQNA